MKEYWGIRTAAGSVVSVNGQPLSPRHDLRNHSPDGFEGDGSAPAQLALPILADQLATTTGHRLLTKISSLR